MQRRESKRVSGDSEYDRHSSEAFHRRRQIHLRYPQETKYWNTTITQKKAQAALQYMLPSIWSETYLMNIRDKAKGFLLLSASTIEPRSGE